MEKTLEILQSNFSAKFWLSDGGLFIYSNICTLHPSDLKFIANLDLVVDTYISNLFDFPRLRFYKAV